MCDETQERQTRQSRRDRRALARSRKKAAGNSGAVLASGAALTLGVAMAAAPAAQAATFTVINLNDSGAGSLRQAIEDANAAAGADVVDFQAGLTGTITLTTGQLSITDSVDVQGPGAAVLTVSGNNASRVFYLYNGSALLDVTLSGLTITEGSDTIGAGVVNFDENLLLDGVTITGNTASGDGGGLWADGFNMNLTIRDSTISGNTAGSDGGGIYVEDTGGPLLIQNTVISGNQAADDGGGIYFYDPDDSTTIEGSTISGNTAGDLGGGIYLYDTDGGTHLINGTTISGNSATAGGGLFLYGPDNPFAIESSTISGNQATAGDGGGIFLYAFYNGFDIRHCTVASNSATGAGGGIFTQTGPLVVEHTIVGDNSAPTNADLGTVGDGSIDLAFSLVEAPGTANFTDNGGNILNQDPQLGPLANNGGPTQTHLPAAASPAVNAGDPAFAPPPATDQRGLARVSGGRIDIGAVEIAPGTVQLSAATYSVNENGVTATITVTRTGGSDGALSVSYQTSDGTANQPADYQTAAGVLNWANGDAASKTFQITIVDDLFLESDETVNITLTGGNLGSPATAVLIIVNNDLPAPAPGIPTLGDAGKFLFAGLCALAALLALRRRKLAAPVIALTLAAGTAGAVQAAPGKASETQEVRAATLTQIQTEGNQVVLRLSDGTTLRATTDHVTVQDRRRGRRGPSGLQGLSQGQPVLLEIKHGPSGAVKKVKVELYDTAARAQAQAAARND